MPAKSSKARATSQIYAVVGSDESEVKRRAKELASELAPAEGGDFAIETVDGAVENAEQAVTRIHQTIEAIQTWPFFGRDKLVWLKDVSFLGDTITGRATAVQETLEELKEFLGRGLPDGVVLLLSAPEIDKRRGFFKALGKIATLEQFDRIDTSRSGWEEDAEAIVHPLAAERRLRFEPEAIEVLVRLAGADSRQLRNEVEKIDLYLGSQRNVTADVVRQLVAKSATGVIWELSTSLSKRRLGESLALLDQLLFQGETAMAILYAAIIPTVRNLLAVKDLMQRYNLRAPSAPFQFNTILAKLPEEATKHLPRKKDGTINAYALGLAACEAHRFELDELIEGVRDCLRANLQLVTTQLVPKFVLGQLLVKLIGR